MYQSHYTSTYEPIYIPMTDDTTGESKRNTRRCRCARCKRELLPGQGYKWDFNQLWQEYVLNGHSSYYCPECHAERSLYLQIMPRVEAAMYTIREWCKTWVILSMGYQAAFHIDCIARGCGQARADVVEAIRDALPSLEHNDTSFGVVVRLAKQIAANTMREGGCDDC